MDRDMVERIQQVKVDVTTLVSSAPSSRSSSFSSSSIGPTPKGSWRVKRRLSRSSLASVTTLEEGEHENEIERGSNFDSPSRDQAWASADQPTTSAAEMNSVGDIEIPTQPAIITITSQSLDTGSKHERQRSLAQSFVPSLATLPPSPTQATSDGLSRSDPSKSERTPRSLPGRPQARKPLLASMTGTTLQKPPDGLTAAATSASSSFLAEAYPTSEPIIPFSFPLVATAADPFKPSFTTKDPTSLSQQPTLSPARKFGVHTTPEQRKECVFIFPLPTLMDRMLKFVRSAHRRSFSVEPLLPPHRPAQPTNGHRRANHSISQAASDSSLILVPPCLLLSQGTILAADVKTPTHKSSKMRTKG